MDITFIPSGFDTIPLINMTAGLDLSSGRFRLEFDASVLDTVTITTTIITIITSTTTIIRIKVIICTFRIIICCKFIVIMIFH